MCYFLQEDIIFLEKKISETLEEIKKIGETIGESCDSGADTWHDNFDYEEGMRQMAMVSSHLNQFINIRNKAKVITPNKSNELVSIGKTVHCLIDDKKQIYKIGSYIILNKEESFDIKVISYISPIAKLLINHAVGDTVEGMIAKKIKKIEIISIS